MSIEIQKRSTFRRYVATIMAAFTVGAVIYGALAGVFTNASEGFVGGIIVGLAAKFLWEENTN